MAWREASEDGLGCNRRRGTWFEWNPVASTWFAWGAERGVTWGSEDGPRVGIEEIERILFQAGIDTNEQKKQSST